MRVALIVLASVIVLHSDAFAQRPGPPRGVRKGAPPQKGAAPSLTPNQPDPPGGFDVANDGTKRGKVVPLEFESKEGGGTFRATIYTPPGFSPTESYPVLYLLHGASGDENTWVREIRAAAILDNLYADKKIAPMLVVMPSSLSVEASKKAGNDRTARAEASENFGSVLVRDLVPAVESKYRVIADREHRAIAGLSRGAGLAFGAALTNPDRFAWAGAFSSGGTRRMIDNPRIDLASPGRQFRLLWLSVGDKDTMTASGVAAADAALTGKKIPHVFRVNAGGHEPQVWKNDLYYFAPMLFR